jgi:acyl-CoA thioesterase YciA
MVYISTIDMTQEEIELIKENKFICRNTQFCKGNEVGVHGKMFGGVLLSELDVTCAVFASEICDTPYLVTRNLKVEFISPILPNNIYKTYIKLDNIGNTSLKIIAEIHKHSVHTKRSKIAVKCECTFVRINDEGESIKISDHIRKRYGYEQID